MVILNIISLYLQDTRGRHLVNQYQQYHQKHPKAIKEQFWWNSFTKRRKCYNDKIDTEISSCLFYTFLIMSPDQKFEILINVLLQEGEMGAGSRLKCNSKRVHSIKTIFHWVSIDFLNELDELVSFPPSRLSRFICGFSRIRITS